MRKLWLSSPGLSKLARHATARQLHCGGWRFLEAPYILTLSCSSRGRCLSTAEQAFRALRPSSWPRPRRPASGVKVVEPRLADTVARCDPCRACHHLPAEAYLVAKQGMPLADAFFFLRARRSIVTRPNKATDKLSIILSQWQRRQPRQTWKSSRSSMSQNLEGFASCPSRRRSTRLVVDPRCRYFLTQDAPQRLCILLLTSADRLCMGAS